MKKIYSKITKERAKQYQIETSIYSQENDKCVVEKKALNSEAVSHVDKMIDYYNSQSSKKLLVPARKIKNGCIQFEYVTGCSMYEKILKAARDKEYKKILEVFEQYKNILDLLYDGQTYDIIQENINVDLTFDNIIITQNENVVIVDYEWIFDNRYTLGFSIYRALNALYLYDASLMNEIVSFDECMDFFGILPQKKLFENQNIEFNKLVFGDMSYNEILQRYQKDGFDIMGIISESDMFTQIYFDYGDGYSEKNSRKYEIKNKHIDLCVEIVNEVKALRIDPCNFPFIAKNISIYGIIDSSEKKLANYKDNAIRLEDGYCWFWNNDPQIILTQDEIQNIHKVRIVVEMIDVVNELKISKNATFLGEQMIMKGEKYNQDLKSVIEQYKEHVNNYNILKNRYDNQELQYNKLKSQNEEQKLEYILLKEQYINELTEKERLCEKYREIVETLTTRLNKINAKYRISLYENMEGENI